MATIVYYDRKKIVLAVVEKIEGKAVHVVDEFGKRFAMPQSKVAGAFESVVSQEDSRLGVGNKLNKFRKFLEVESKTIDLQALHALLLEDEENKHCGFEVEFLFDLHGAYSSRLSKGFQILGMFLALSQDHVFFYMKQFRYYPYSMQKMSVNSLHVLRERQGEIKKKAKETLLFEELRSWFIAEWGNDARNNPLEGKVLELVCQFFKPLQNWLIRETKVQKEVSEVLQKLKQECLVDVQDNIHVVALLLWKLGVFKTKDEFLLVRHSVLVNDDILDFNDLRVVSPHERYFRKDYSFLPSFTIDDEETCDFDDAFSLEVLNNCYRVHVHIADVAFFVQHASSLDLYAQKRMSSIYTPIAVYSMLPKLLTENLASLVEGKLRPALTFMFDFEKKSLECINVQLSRSWIVVEKNFSYKAIDVLLSNMKECSCDSWNSIWFILHKISSHLKEKRLNSGGCFFSSNDIKLKVPGNASCSPIELVAVDLNENSHLIVQELMVLTNVACAQFCQEQDIPVPYVRQDPPMQMPECLDWRNLSRAQQHEMLRNFKASAISLESGRHFGLGVDVYMHCTSPLRRYQDLFAHHQLSSFLSCGKPLVFDTSELMILILKIQNMIVSNRTAERQIFRFWMFQFLKENQHETFRAIVLKKLRNGYFVDVLPCAIKTFVMSSKVFHLDQEVGVLIKKVCPEDNVLILELI